MSITRDMRNSSRESVSQCYLDVLEKYSDYDIYSFFIGKDIGIGQLIQSPNRYDETATFNIFYPTRRRQLWDGQILFKDFNGEAGNVFMFVKKWAAYNEGGLYLGTNQEICQYILRKMGGENIQRKAPPKVPDEATKFNVTLMKMAEAHLQYWNELGVFVDLLTIYNVYACQYLLKENNLIYQDFEGTVTFAYVIFDRFKLYQPFEENFKKFFNQCPHNYMQGYEQCRGVSDTLYITKSMKDILVYQALTEEWIDCIAPHGEGYILEDNWIWWMLQYRNIVIIYDFDLAGVKGANRLRKQLFKSQHYTGNNVRVEFVDSKRNLKRGKCVVAMKDISDLRLVYGHEAARQRVNQMFYGWRKSEGKERKESRYQWTTDNKLKGVEE